MLLQHVLFERFHLKLIKLYDVLKSLSNYIKIGLNIKQYFKCIYFTVNHYWLAAIVMESPSKHMQQLWEVIIMCKVCSPLAGHSLKILLKNLYTPISSRPSVNFWSWSSPFFQLKQKTSLTVMWAHLSNQT